MSVRTRGLPKRALILTYLQVYLGDWVSYADLRAASGLDDVPRSVRQLRQDGYQIEINGQSYCRLTLLDPDEPVGVRGPVTGTLRLAVFERDGYRCRICGATPDVWPLVVDHIVPVAHGGPTILNNLQVLCEQCNREKGSKIVNLERTAAALLAILTNDQRVRLLTLLAQPNSMLRGQYDQLGLALRLGPVLRNVTPEAK